MIRGPVAEEATVSEAQVFNEVGLSASACALGGAGVCERFIVGDVVLGVAANEAFVSLADDVCLASSVGSVAKEKQMRSLWEPVRTREIDLGEDRGDLPQDADLDDGADDGVHACAVAARREDRDLDAGWLCHYCRR